jgi:FkbM family methyltransferase
MKKFINSIIKLTGYQLRPVDYIDVDLKRRFKIMKSLNINMVFDVGANKGQYAQKLREFGYTGRIISFEPLNNVFEKLKQASTGDSTWEVHNCALGNEDTSSFINIAGNTDSSSILNMLPEHVKNAPNTEYVGRQEVAIKKLDSIIDSITNGQQYNIMLKSDTQGYEESVLRGAEKSLPQIKMLQLEMSLVPLYESEMLYMDMLRFLDGKNFCLYSVENGFSSRTTGRMLQMDGILVNKNFAE